jgi:hypothetical protein
VLTNLSAANQHEFQRDSETAPVTTSLDGGVELYGREKVAPGIDDVLRKWNRQRADPDYEPSWGSAASMSHLAYPED